MSVSAQQIPWYHKTSIYQIYPRSYYDSNGDGIGDIQGIIQKLDYIQDLGFETIWCSPFFKSPQRDFGYDISDYTDIAPEYGTREDAIQLINEVHKRGMRIVFDMVMNHTSDEHAWFTHDTLQKGDLSTDYYLWRDKPNGWKNTLKTKGWHYNKTRGQYYWASFLSFQPDLNYRNPAVKKAMFDAVKFWLEKGVDGYRLDMFNSIYKDEEFRNTPASRKEVSKHYNTKGFRSNIKGYVNQPASFGFAKELRSVCDTFGERLLLGEIFGNHQMIKRFLGEQKNDGLTHSFNFEMLRFKFSAAYFHKLIAGLEADFPYPYAPVYTFSNHDRRRSMRRLNGDVQKAKLLHLLQLTLRGTACMYYGEEIGMSDYRMPYKNALDPIPHLYKGLPRFLVDLAGETLNRDELRTPMQWDSSAQAGFSKSAKTWLPVHTNYTDVNVVNEQANPNSLYHTVRQLLQVRKTMPALNSGILQLLDKRELPANVLGYVRTTEADKVAVLINFSKAGKEITLPEGYTHILLQIGNTNASIKGNRLYLHGLSGVLLKP